MEYLKEEYICNRVNDDVGMKLLERFDILKTDIPFVLEPSSNIGIPKAEISSILASIAKQYNWET